MPRTSNYRFERHERERLKAAKKAERVRAKQERRDSKKATNDPAPPDDQPGEPAKDD